MATRAWYCPSCQKSTSPSKEKHEVTPAQPGTYASGPHKGRPMPALPPSESYFETRRIDAATVARTAFCKCGNNLGSEYVAPE